MLAYAGDGAIRQRHHEEQAEQMWCLTLATNAVVTWTSEYNGLAVTALRRAGRDSDDAVLAPSGRPTTRTSTSTAPTPSMPPASSPSPAPTATGRCAPPPPPRRSDTWTAEVPQTGGITITLADPRCQVR